MNKQMKDAIVVGFALFAMFFGAGNLIFPPTLGKTVGTQYLTATGGFVLTAAGLPLMGILACAKCNGTFPTMTDRVGKIFSVIASVALVIAIGPLLAVPRTAATTFELSVRPFFPHASVLVSVTIYFVICFLFLVNPSSIVDRIGKILTPALLILLITLIVKALISPMGPVVKTPATNVLADSLLLGYQTMDAMTVTILATLILGAFRDKGYTTYKQIMNITIKAGLIAVGGLAIIYGGLAIIGSQTTTLYSGNVERTQLVVDICQKVLGNFGTIALAIVVALACLTTAIGITSGSATYFTNLTKGKIPYKVNAGILSFASIIVATMGVDNIVAFADPILQVLYPVVMVLIILTLLGNIAGDNRIVRVTVYTTLIVSLGSVAVNVLNLNLGALGSFIKGLPFSQVGFAWAIPAIIAFCISKIFFKGNDLNITSEAVEQ